MQCGKNDATSGRNEANKDVASDIGAGDHAMEKKYIQT